MKNSMIFEFLDKKYVDISGSEFPKMWILRVKYVENVNFSVKMTKNGLFDVFNPPKSIFMKIQTNLYRRIFWRGIQKWPYFCDFVGEKRAKSRKNVKNGLFEGVTYIKRHFHPLAVNFFKK